MLEIVEQMRGGRNAVEACRGLEWPDWVPARAHHCLVGCLACQRACPANSKLRVEDSAVRFSFAETRALVETDAAQTDRAEIGIRAKLAWLGQPGLEPVLGRNLRALLAARR